MIKQFCVGWPAWVGCCLLIVLDYKSSSILRLLFRLSSGQSAGYWQPVVPSMSRSVAVISDKQVNTMYICPKSSRQFGSWTNLKDCTMIEVRGQTAASGLGLAINPSEGSVCWAGMGYLVSVSTRPPGMVYKNVGPAMNLILHNEGSLRPEIFYSR
jgi:hypothetical protein